METTAPGRPAPAEPPPVPAPGDLDLLSINAVRILAMDAVQKADSGHPGTPMALAPLAYLLYTRYMRHDPADPHWPNRDRFVLSAGHACMLQYAALYLSGYALTLDDIKQFRQWGSKTPGHPEYGHTPGIEVTTGPLGQGVGNAVGMAVAEAHLAAVFNRPGHTVVDHHTYFICSDGDLMEGISHEAASFAGHFQLGKLIGFYDDNHITIDGSTDLTYTDDVAERFTAYGWHVQRVPDINDLETLSRAIDAARAQTARPSLIICRTHIGYGSPKQDSPKAHGEALGVDAVAQTRKTLRWPWPEAFFVPPEAIANWRRAQERGRQAHEEWQMRYASYQSTHPDAAAELDRRLRRVLPADWESLIPTFTAENGTLATRASAGAVLNAIMAKTPALVGGSADLSQSNSFTALTGIRNFAPDDRSGRYFHFGIREHGMAAIMNGMAVHGGLIPFGGTFLVFSDYMRPSVRLAALMRLQVIYVYSHDSIGLGEDGPTHQPVEQLTALRCIPNMTVIRPADSNEAAFAWRAAMTHVDGPVALVLSRQKLPYIDRSRYASAAGTLRGAYVLADAPGGPPQVVLVASGSEVSLILEAQQRLTAAGVRARIVSAPSLEIFAAQAPDYQQSVLPPAVPRVAVEAAHPMSWYRWVGSTGAVLGLERFGASAPYQRVYQELGITTEHVVQLARDVMAGARG